MKAEAEANADADKKAKEEIDKLNAADSLVFQTEKQLKEFGDKVPAEDKVKIEEAAAKLKQAHSDKNIAAIDAATAELNAAWNEASQKMYAASGQQPGNTDPCTQPGGPFDPENMQNTGAGAGQQAPKDEEGVTDVEFEEVK